MCLYVPIEHVNVRVTRNPGTRERLSASVYLNFRDRVLQQVLLLVSTLSGNVRTLRPRDSSEGNGNCRCIGHHLRAALALR